LTQPGKRKGGTVLDQASDKLACRRRTPLLLVVAATGLCDIVPRLGGKPNSAILDADGKGTVYLNGKQLTFATRHKGDTVWPDTAGYSYALIGGRLEVNDPFTIEGFDNGELGIYLDEEEDPSGPNKSPKPPGYNPDNASQARRIDPLVLDLDGNGRIDAVASTSSTVYFDFNDDGISERAGWIAAQDGILALDANSNGSIDGLGELFGSTQIDGFAELAQHDSNGDGKIDNQDDDYTKLRVWQDANQDGISQAAEIKTLDSLGITSIDLATTPANTAIADNLVTATGSFTRNGQTQLAADIHLAVNFALTDSNPNRPLGLPPQLDPAVFDLPWLRGYGNVKSLPVAYQEDPALRQTASDLQASGWLGAVRDFNGFMAQWSGLAQAHAQHGVTRTRPTIEDKVWMLESLTGQDKQKSAIEAANFGTVTPGVNRTWNTAYIDSQWNSFVQQEAMSFAVQVGTKDWLKGANYSLNLDRFIVTDAARVQQSLIGHLNSIADKEEAAFAAVAISKLKQDGVALDAAAIKLGLANSPWRTLFEAVLAPAPITGTVLVGTGGADGGSSLPTPRSRRWRDGERRRPASNDTAWRIVA